MTGKILIIGSLNMDLVVYTQRHPQIGETVFGSSFSTFTGGKGANQAVAMARLGAHVQMIGKIGEDDFGQALLDNLNKNEVRTETILTTTTQTGTALITVDSKGQNSIIVVPGANNTLTPQDIDLFETVIADMDLLVMQLEIPLETVCQAAKIAKRYDVTTILNPAPAVILPDEIYQLTDYLIPNEFELASLSGLSTQTKAQAEKAVNALKQKGVKNIVVTMGEKGVFWFGEKDQLFIPSISVEAVDTTAAGDAFIGGFATALAEGAALPDALNFGNAAGAIAVTKKGAQSSLPNRSEVERYLNINNL